MEHYNLEVTCEYCGESMLLYPTCGHAAYTEICSTCGERVAVPADTTDYSK